MRSVVLAILLMGLLSSTIVAADINWWQIGAGTLAGAGSGAVVGSAVPGLGTLAGAGIGALIGFVSTTVPQLLPIAPTWSSNPDDWGRYSKDVYAAIAQESQLIADNEISQTNLARQSQPIFTVSAQKWEQVNYDVQIPPTTPYYFYKMLVDTGFLDYATKVIGGSQALWVEEYQQINSINKQINPHGYRITFNNFPNNSVSIGLNWAGVSYVVIVVGSIYVSGGSNGVAHIYKASPNGATIFVTLNQGQGIMLTSGAYIIDNVVGLSISPLNGTALIFKYGYNSYTPINWGYQRPTWINLWGPYSIYPINSTYLPAPNETLPYIFEEIAVSMLGAAETEYQTLKSLGYSSASEIPANMTLPSLEINVGNFTKFNDSLSAYNYYMALYSREILQMAQTLQSLNESGRLRGLQELSFNVTNPLSAYGQYGGFVVNGKIILPNGQMLDGMYLIQPYGGPLTLSDNGGTIGSGGAVAYQLVPMPDGKYGIGSMYLLPPNTTIQGNVLNPGTLSPVQEPQKSDYYNTTTYQSPQDSSSAIDNLWNYLKDHPPILIISIFFGLIIVIALLRVLL